MTIAETDLDAFASLTRALGITTATTTNSAWFTDPVGGSSTNPTGLRTILGNDDQRHALESFVDEVLGEPDAVHEGDATWVPLFRHTDPTITVYAVLTAVTGAVRIGVGVSHSTGDTGPRVTSRLHVPLFHVPRGSSDSRPPAGALPRWLLVGREGGRVTIDVDAVLTDDAPVPREAFLRGVHAVLEIPTDGVGDVGLSLELRDLQLPGATTPSTQRLGLDELDDLAAVGEDVIAFVVGLLRAQVAALDLTVPALRVTAGLAGLLGLRDTPGLTPPPLAELPRLGVAALVDWAEGVLGDPTARATWLGQLATLTDGTPHPDEDAVAVDLGEVTLVIGLRVAPGPGGHPVLTPWLRLERELSPGSRLAATVEALRIDTATGSVTALPMLAATATFGVLAGGPAVIGSGPVQIGSLRVGLGLDAQRHPAPVLTLHDVLTGGTRHDLLDLSTPQAVIDAADDVVTGALTDLLDGLGTAGDIVATVLGVSPPTGVPAVSVVDLVGDPLGALRDYWRLVLAHPSAPGVVLGRIAEALGRPAGTAPGSGTAELPWRLALAGPAALVLWRDGPRVRAGVEASVGAEVTAETNARLSVRAELLAADLTTGATSFLGEAGAVLAMTPRGADPVRVELPFATLLVGSAGVAVTYRAGRGLSVAPVGDDLRVELRRGSPGMPGGELEVVDLPLPAVAADGTVTFAPDWDDIELLVAHLLGGPGAGALAPVLDLLGWAGDSGPRLHLGRLLTDPAGALVDWAADLALDCGHLRETLGALATLLSGGRLRAPLGTGHRLDPFRMPVAGSPAAPGVAVWTDPVCASVGDLAGDPGWEPGPQPDGPALAAALRRAAAGTPDLADLVFARPSLGDGLDALATRCAGTDGLVGAPTTLPAGVTSAVLDGYGYEEARAAALLDPHPWLEMPPAPATRVVVTSDRAWWLTHAEGSRVDATGVTPPPLSATSTDLRLVLLPTVTLATAPGATGVAAQAARLAEVLAARTVPVHVVADGGTGAAALRAASLPAMATVIAAVSTIGAPWGPVSTAGFAGHGGNALALLSGLAGDAPVVGDDALAHTSGPLQRVWGLLRRATAGQQTADLPSAADEPVRPGLVVHAIFGALARTDVHDQVEALLRQVTTTRRRALTGVATTVDSLHAGLSLPPVEVELGGLSVGLDAAYTLLGVHRAAPRVRLEQSLAVTLRLGVADGWLVGGPGASQRDLETRWVEARVTLPLGSAAPATCELVLHEARAYAVERERWLVRAGGDGVTATTALPEVRVLLGAVVARLRTDAPAVSDLLEAVGLVRAGGLDPTGLDRVLFDPGPTLRAAVTEPARLVAALRGLTATPSSVPAGRIRFGGSAAHVDIDLAARTLSATAEVTAEAVPRVEARLDVAPSGAALTVALGATGPDGGVRATLKADATGPRLHLDVATPGRPTRQVPLLPSADPAGLVDLVRVLVPAVATRALVEALRGHAGATERAVWDGALAALGLLGDPDPRGLRPVRLPIGLVTDPGGWLSTRAEPAAAAVALLDAVAAVVLPDRVGPGWPLTDELTIGYAVESGRLRLSADLAVAATLDATPVALTVGGALVVGTETVAARLGATATVSGYGLELTVGADPVTPVALALVRPAPAPRLAIVPPGAGLGQVVDAAAQSVVVIALTELIGRRTSTSAPLRRVAVLAHELCAALDLLATTPTGDRVDPVRVSGFAADPGARLLARLPELVATGLTSLATALDPAGTVVRAPSAHRLVIGSGTDVVSLDLDGAARAVTVGLDVDLGGLGRLVVDGVRISAAGVGVEVHAGPFDVALGDIHLHPVVAVRVGVTGAGVSRLVSVGLATTQTGTDAVMVEWALDSTPPRPVARSGGTPTTDLATVATTAVGIAVSIASSIVADALGSVIDDDATARLQDVVFTGGGRTIDPGLVIDLLDPVAILGRLQTLAWNCAAVGTPVSVTIDGVVTIGLAAVPVSGGEKHLGVRVSLPPGGRLVLAEGDVTVALEADASWVGPDVPAGLSILVLRGTRDALRPEAGVVVGGIGLRFTAAGKPLLDLGSIAIDGIAVRVYAEASAAGVGGGAQLVLDGLAFSPGGGGGGNALANSMMTDVGSASASARPAFSPAIGVVRRPGRDLALSLRAGDPPGPWWIVIQRQLGPLYVERIGFGTAESGGRVTRVSLLFTGQLSLFGLTAAVEELSISWTGGDVLSISSWSVDLMGLAISAELAGLTLAGGLLKIDEPDGVSYVGMLVGRYAAYGLSVFGGFSNHAGHASFFVFGGVNGPIGGPPAFFVTGLGGGLGINRGLIVPDDLSQFGDYPFIQALDPAARPPDRPLDRLKELAAYFPHQMGNFWFAAGVSFTCFSLVDGIAVVAVSFGGDGLDLILFGLARLALPRPGAAIVSIELALLARFSTREGVFMIRAQLTDNSWLLYEDVRLTGGFAFAIWWKGPLKGQFVLTMGGYHPSFHVEGYPDVPRLGLVWRISDALVIKGGSYFALTSEALMAGQSVEVSLDLGWVWARVSFGADGIVWFDPFSFDVVAYARISAGIHIDLWLTTLSLSITLGAKIHVWGPDFAGEVVFEIGPATVPIRFGGTDQRDLDPISWPAFVTKYLEDAGAGTARALSGITGRGTLPTSTGGEVGAPSSDGSAALPFRVFAEFEISLTTTVPATRIVAGASVTVPVRMSSGAAAQLGIAPMGAQVSASTVTVTLWRRDGSGTWAPVPSLLSWLSGGLAVEAASGPRISLDSFPLGVWGPPKPVGSGTPALPSPEVVSAGNRVTLVAGVAALAVGPQVDYYRVDAKRRPLPLNATRATRQSMLKVTRDLPAPAAATTADALRYAADVLFAEGGQPRSALARAGFTRQRCAPPLAGALTDGLAVDGGADGHRERVEAPVGRAPTARRPLVVGHLTAGTRAAARPVPTTVADNALARRGAPTVASVRSRLGRRLPIELDRTPRAAVAREGTVLTTQAVPRTAVAGSSASHSGGRLAAPGLQDLVGGLGARAGRAPRGGIRPRRVGRAAQARAAAVAASLRAGDVVVLESRDARIDADPDRRPALSLSGAGRVVALAGHHVLLDVALGAQGGTVDLPPGHTLVAIRAGAEVEPADGYAGWYDGARVARLGAQAAVGAGCVLTTEVSDPAGHGVEWQSAGVLAGGARSIRTRFDRPVHTVAVALTGSVPTSLRPTELHLDGARPARHTGSDVPPTLVTVGAVSVLVHAVVPDRDAAAVEVGVRIGAQWALAGVLGCNDDVDTVARRIARDGLPAATARLLATTGPGVEVQWIDPRRTR